MPLWDLLSHALIHLRHTRKPIWRWLIKFFQWPWTGVFKEIGHSLSLLVLWMDSCLCSCYAAEAPPSPIASCSLCRAAAPGQAVDLRVLCTTQRALEGILTEYIWNVIPYVQTERDACLCFYSVSLLYSSRSSVAVTPHCPCCCLLNLCFPQPSRQNKC